MANTDPTAGPNPAKDVPAQEPAAGFAAMLRHRAGWLVGVALVVIAGALGYYWMVDTAAVNYTTVAVERGDVESRVVAAGIVQPVKYVDVGAQTSGKLKSLKVKRGDQVELNQLIAEIDPVLTETAIRATTAALESLTAQHNLKQAQLALAKAQFTRSDKVFLQGGGVSANDRDIAHANYDIATADVASTAAQMKQASAAIDTANANLTYTKITAPMAGEVVSINLVEGQTLNANQSAPIILRIADIGNVTVWAQVSEADIIRVKAGQEVYFTVLGSSQRWTGKVSQILPTPELISNVVFYDVLFDIANTTRELKIQMTAQVFIVLAKATGVLLLPAAVIGNAGEGAATTVRVLKADGSVEQRAIKIGIKGELTAEVTEGLQEKEHVVLKETSAPRATTSALSARRGP